LTSDDGDDDEDDLLNWSPSVYICEPMIS